MNHKTSLSLLHDAWEAASTSSTRQRHKLSYRSQFSAAEHGPDHIQVDERASPAGHLNALSVSMALEARRSRMSDAGIGLFVVALGAPSYPLQRRIVPSKRFSENLSLPLSSRRRPLPSAYSQNHDRPQRATRSMAAGC